MRAKVLLAVLTLLIPSQALGEGRSSCVANATSALQARGCLCWRGASISPGDGGESRRRPDFSLLGMLQARGLTHIRLPVAPEFLLESFSDRHAIANQLNELDFAIQKLLDIGFAVSLDVHPGGKFPACMHPIRMRASDFCSPCGKRWPGVTADIRPNDCFWKFSTNHQCPSKSGTSRARVWWRRCGGKRRNTPSSTGRPAISRSARFWEFAPQRHQHRLCG